MIQHISNSFDLVILMIQHEVIKLRLLKLMDPLSIQWTQSLGWSLHHLCQLKTIYLKKTATGFLKKKLTSPDCNLSFAITVFMSLREITKAKLRVLEGTGFPMATSSQNASWLESVGNVQMSQSVFINRLSIIIQQKHFLALKLRSSRCSHIS